MLPRKVLGALCSSWRIAGGLSVHVYDQSWPDQAETQSQRAIVHVLGFRGK